MHYISVESVAQNLYPEIADVQLVLAHTEMADSHRKKDRGLGAG